MILHRRDTLIFDFLNECNKSFLEKKILDCGAGGGAPPLAIFYRNGYKTHGIELLDSQIKRAKTYEKEHNMRLNIIKGDMRNLPYEGEYFSFVFSHHTIHHLCKKDIAITMMEMERVLVPGGLIYVNFPPYESNGYGVGEEREKGEFVMDIEGEEVMHCFFEDDEAEEYFRNFEIISKRKWILLKNEGWVDNVAMIEYVARKK